MIKFSPNLKVMTEITVAAAASCLMGVIYQKRSAALFFAAIFEGSLAIFYATGRTGEKFEMQKWKVRLLQGILIGGYVGTLIATKVVNNALVVAVGVALVSWRSFHNAHYLHQKHPERKMQDAFAESFFLKQLFGFCDDAEDRLEILEQEKRQDEQKIKQGEQQLKQDEQKIKQGEQQLKQDEQKIKQIEQKIKQKEEQLKQIEQKIKQKEEQLKQNRGKLQQNEEQLKQNEEQLDSLVATLGRSGLN